MPIQNTYQRVPLEQIAIARDARQRRDIALDANFVGSIKRHGVLVPIIVGPNSEAAISSSAGVVLPWLLIAGERRLEASRQCGFADIPVRFASELTLVERQLFELEENVKRRELRWQDVCLSVARIHSLQRGLDPDWQRAQTAEFCAIDPSAVTHYLTIFEAWDDPSVQAAGTYREAYNLLLRRTQRAQGVALQELLDWTEPQQQPASNSQPVAMPAAMASSEAASTEAPVESGLPRTATGPSPSPTATAPSSPILCLDAVEWMKTYSGPKFNLLHCDFPYGIGLFNSNGIRSGPQRSQMGRDSSSSEGYEDEPEYFQLLVETLAANLNRFFSIQGHIMFWFSNKWEIEARVRAKFAELAPSISWSRFPLIWLKSDNAGIAASPQYEPRHIYETCLLGSQGKRPIVRIVSDAYSAPTDKSIHVSAKPEPMLRHFMTMLVDESTSLLDPTCGSGTALRAAESLGASRILGLEKDPQMAEQARRALELERAKRRAAKTLRSAPLDF
jgi:hypothetical protein